jgi:hypothetical protein
MAQETPQNPGIPRRRPTPPPGARVSSGSTSASSSSAQKPAAPASANGPAGIPRNSGIPFGSNSIPPNPKPANGPAGIPRNSGIPLSSFLALSLAPGGPDPSAAAVPAPSFPAPDYTRMNLGACRCWDDYQAYDINAERHWILALWQVCYSFDFFESLEFLTTRHLISACCVEVQCFPKVGALKVVSLTFSPTFSSWNTQSLSLLNTLGALPLRYLSHRPRLWSLPVLELHSLWILDLLSVPKELTDS